MDNGWEESARAWIREMGEEGDFGRRWVLDPAMLERAGDGPGDALDVGCGEGRFCRALAHRGWRTTGIDPTDRLIVTARERDTAGAYARAEGEKLPFGGARFDLVVSYLTLIDIADFRAAIGEMARVLKPGGRLLVANLANYNTAAANGGWVRDWKGAVQHFAMDDYMEERAVRMEYRGIRVWNHHRPLSAYMQRFFEVGLVLREFAEPGPVEGAPAAKTEKFLRAPNFVVMEWEKEGGKR